MSDELKPCPCGKEARFMQCAFGKWTVHCGGDADCFALSGEYVSKEAAAIIWNRRQEAKPANKENPCLDCQHSIGPRNASICDECEGDSNWEPIRTEAKPMTVLEIEHLIQENVGVDYYPVGLNEKSGLTGIDYAAKAIHAALPPMPSREDIVKVLKSHQDSAIDRDTKKEIKCILPWEIARVADRIMALFGGKVW